MEDNTMNDHAYILIQGNKPFYQHNMNLCALLPDFVFLTFDWKE